MTSIHKSLALSLIDRYFRILIALLGNMILARLLTPEEIGIYSVSLAVIGIAYTIRGFGLGNFLIQEQNLTDAHIRTTFGFALLIGWTLFLVVFFASPYVAAFYADDRLLQILYISSLNFLILPFCSISIGLLQRAMAFDRLIIVNTVAASTGFVITISLAYIGLGPISMAIASIATNIVTGIAAWLARTDRKLLLPGMSEWRTVLNFGGQSSVTAVVNTIATDINDLALGKILGFAPVAIISRAQGLMNLFHRDLMTAVHTVAFPAFAKAHRTGINLEKQYITSVTNVTVIAWPFYGFTSLYALELIRLLFGSQWDASVTLVSWFCLAGASAATCNLILKAMTAVGRIDLVMKAELLFQPIYALTVVLTAVVFQSVLSCAIAFAIVFTLHPPLLYAFKSRCIPNDYKSLFSQLWLSVKVSLVTLLIPFGMIIYVGFDRTEPMKITLLLISILLCALSWFFALMLFKHPITKDPLFQRLMTSMNITRYLN
jgi:O-antigen/teichoic acid export membrane protein